MKDKHVVDSYFEPSKLTFNYVYCHEIQELLKLQFLLRVNHQHWTYFIANWFEIICKQLLENKILIGLCIVLMELCEQKLCVNS